jgi:hypothetical protein
MVDAKALDVLAEVLELPHGKVRQGTVEICEALTAHDDFLLKLFSEENPCSRLVSILRRVQFLIFGLSANGRTVTQSTMSSVVWYTPSIALRNLAKAHKLRWIQGCWTS